MELMARTDLLFTDKLTQLVRASGQSQAQIASEVGITPQSLSRYLEGSAPRPDIALRLARFFSVDPIWLMDEEQPMADPPPKPGQSLSNRELFTEMARRFRLDMVRILEMIEAVEARDVKDEIIAAFRVPFPDASRENPLASDIGVAAEGADSVEHVRERYSVEQYAFTNHETLPGSDRDPYHLLQSEVAKRAEKLKQSRPELEWAKVYRSMRGQFGERPDRLEHFEKLRQWYLDMIERGESVDPTTHPTIVNAAVFNPDSAQAKHFMQQGIKERDRRARRSKESE